MIVNQNSLNVTDMLNAATKMEDTSANVSRVTMEMEFIAKVISVAIRDLNVEYIVKININVFVASIIDMVSAFSFSL